MKTKAPLFLCLAGLLMSASMTASGADDDVQAEGWRRDRDRGPQRAPSIIIFERANFRGASLEIEIDGLIPDLRELRYPNGSRVNNKISSIQIGRGAQVRIYESDDFAGEFLDLTRSVDNLASMARAGGRNWGNAISSLRVVENRYPRQRWRDPSRQPRVIVFSRKDFQGQAFEIYPGESFDNLSREHFDNGADLNAEISSIRIVGPVRLRLHEEKRFRGEKVEITSDVADLNRLRRADPRKDWNDKASSLSVEWIGPAPRFDAEPDDDTAAPTPAPSPAPGRDPRDVIKPPSDRKPKPGDAKPGSKPAGEL